VSCSNFLHFNMFVSHLLFNCYLMLLLIPHVIAEFMTFYTPDGGQGACGDYLQNNYLIIAMNKEQYDERKQS
jgi:hypothetical protein